MPETAENSNIRQIYEEGKHRRYNLLFAVNGGAFAIVQLFADFADLGTIDSTDHVLGRLASWHLSLGMALFTIVMVLDIFVFGQSMRQKRSDLFAWQGKLVLILIGGLIMAGWTLASSDVVGRFIPLLFIGYLVSIAVVYLVMMAEEQQQRSGDKATKEAAAKHWRLAIIFTVGVLSLIAGFVAGAFIV